jgi:radical SAM protein with 4Fe4S-binding SPASM domain
MRFYIDPAKAVIVKGARNAALYSFATGEVLSIDNRFFPYIDSHSIEIVDATGPLAASFATRGIGRTADAFSFPPEPPDFNPEPPDFAWLELTADCNLRCAHCYGSCGPATDANGTLSIDEWLSVAAGLRRLGFSRIQLIGGEPLLYPGFCDLLEGIAQKGFSFIEVFSNATMLDDGRLAAIARAGAHLATTVYAADPAVHDRVTGKTGSFAATVDAVRRARKLGIPVRISCIVSSINEKHHEPVADLAASLGARFGGFDQVRPTGRGASSACATSIPHPPVKPPFFTSRPQFEHTRTANPCWYGKCAVIADGTVIPCVFARDRVAGNVRKTPLETIVESDLKPRFWSLTKDNITTCKSCEYRYACPDCRPLASGCDCEGDLYAKTARCAYEPEQGKWR